MQKINDEIYNAARVEHEKGNYEKAFKLYSEGVEQGDVRCNYGVALFYNHGYFVEKDDAKAAEIFALAFPSIKELAEKNEPISCCIIGFYYFNGFYVSEDKKVAIEWLKKSASLGYALAQNIVALRYYNGWNVEEDKAEAFKWFSLAAESGIPEAQFYMGVYYDFAYGVKEDKFEAVKWYKKAAEQGYATAQYNLGNCYYNGAGVKEDKAEAVKWYAKAAVQGYTKAQNNLGCCYDKGAGVKEDKIEAVKWYQIAAKQGNSSAQYNLAICYDKGEGVKKDKVEAVKWYRKSAEQGHIKAQFNLGSCYRIGDGVEVDNVEAVEWYKKAAERGHRTAQYNLAICYDTGCGIKKNRAEAIKWYRKAAEHGYPAAQFNLAVYLYNGEGLKENKTEAVKWYAKAAEQGHTGAQNNLASCYDAGFGIKEDKAEAVKWWRKAAEQGDDSAQCNLGKCYYRGNGVDKSVDEALKWFTKAAEQGHTSSLYNCGIVYLREKKEYTIAKDFFEKTLLKGYIPANYGLAELYKDGNGVLQDGKKAISLYRKVLDDKSLSWLFDDVYEHLAQMYDENYPFCKGIYKDNFKAKEYYEKAIENGADCKSDLKTLETLMHIDDSEANRMGEFVKEIAQKNIPLTSLYAVVEERLKQEFGAVWDRLQSGTKECLITGCISYVALISTGEENYKNMDFSSAILPMVKACEIELGRIFFDKFLEYLQKNNIPPTEFDPEMQKFVVEDKVNNKPEEYNSDEKYIYYRVEKSEGSGSFNYVSPDKTGVFTLGGIDKYAGISKGPMPEPIMQTAKFTFGKNGAEVERKPAYGKTKIVITVNKHVLAFMNEVFTEDAFPGDDRGEQIKKYLYSLSTRVRDMAFKLRNPSSHTGVMPFWKALYCANMVIMVDRILFDFVSKLKPEYTA